MAHGRSDEKVLLGLWMHPHLKAEVSHFANLRDITMSDGGIFYCIQGVKADREAELSGKPLTPWNCFKDYEAFIEELATPDPKRKAIRKDDGPEQPKLTGRSFDEVRKAL